MTTHGGSDARGGRRHRVWAARASVASLAVLGASLVPLTGSTATAAGGRTCVAPPTSASVFVTATCVDPMLRQPYTDVNKLAKTTDPVTGVTVHYRYVHGGFKGTTARFAFYYPVKKSSYQGRFFEGTYPTISTEGTANGHGGSYLAGSDPGSIAFAISHGAYVVTTNNNGGSGAGGALAGYRTNAAAAKYAVVVARKLYGSTISYPRGYIYGASGGAYQTLGAAENTSGVWAGSVPMVPGTPNAIPSNDTILELALRVLHPVLPQIAAAEEPGGSGKPFAGLSPEQAAVLHEATRLGFPLTGWFEAANLSESEFSTFDTIIPLLDSSYVSDFWSLPGYAGADPDVAAARIQYDATVTSLVGSPTSGLVLSGVPSSGDLNRAAIDVTSGAASGNSIPLGTVTGKTVTFGAGADSTVTSEIKAGDTVTLDNSAAIAFGYFQRYQVPTKDMYGWNQYRGTNGKPLYPQIAPLLGPLFDNAAGGAVEDGHFHGKMIMLGSLLDIQAFPWSADWYHKKALSVMGSKRVNANYRLWYMQNSPHDPITTIATHEVPYYGEMQQALLYLDAWVKNGVKPPASTSYHVSSQTQVSVPTTAAARRGVQPVVHLSAKATGHSLSDSVTVAAGRPVTFSAIAGMPPGTGKLISARWDFNGTGTFPTAGHLGKVGGSAHITVTHTFTKAGTYFAAVRFTSDRTGSRAARYGLIQNLARVRVVVQ
jgi:hypothetical protein